MVMSRNSQYVNFVLYSRINRDNLDQGGTVSSGGGVRGNEALAISDWLIDCGGDGEKGSPARYWLIFSDNQHIANN